jgi:hypothetical protein
MQTAPHPRPVRVIVEIDPGQVSSLLAQLVHQFTAHLPAGALPGRSQGQPPRPEPDPDDDDDEPAPAQHLPPPVAHAPPMPRLPAHVGRTRMLGKPCAQGHTYQGSAFCLRKRSNHGCVECEKAKDLARRQGKARPHPQLRVTAPTLVPTSTPQRPELPPHLALTAFLSPILCANPVHRFRDTAYTLRFLDTEGCCQCVAQSSALAGD